MRYGLCIRAPAFSRATDSRMHSFLFAISKDKGLPGRVTRTCDRVVKEWLSPQVGNLRTGVEEHFGSGHAWCWAVPENTRRSELISWVSEPRSVVLAFGDRVFQE